MQPGHVEVDSIEELHTLNSSQLTQLSVLVICVESCALRDGELSAVCNNRKCHYSVTKRLYVSTVPFTQVLVEKHVRERAEDRFGLCERSGV